MKPNPDKYQAMVLGKYEVELNFKLANRRQDFSLGVVNKLTLDNKLKFDGHIYCICRKVKIEKVKESTLRYPKVLLQK